jgi:hypothetical protein
VGRSSVRLLALDILCGNRWSQVDEAKKMQTSFTLANVSDTVLAHLKSCNLLDKASEHDDHLTP